MSISNMSDYRFFFYRRLGHSDFFCKAKMTLGVEVAEMGWDLSLRAQTRRALAMKSIWLREDGEGKIRDDGGRMVGEGNRFWRKKDKRSCVKPVDPVLGFNLAEGSLGSIQRVTGVLSK